MYGSALQYERVQPSLNAFQQLLKLLLFKSALFSANLMIKCIKSFLTATRKQVLKSCFSPGSCSCSAIFAVGDFSTNLIWVIQNSSNVSNGEAHLFAGWA